MAPASLPTRPPTRTRRLAGAVAAVLGVAALAAPGVGGAEATASDAGLVPVTLVAVNDLHGHLEPVDAPYLGGQVGGAAYLATHVQQVRDTHPGAILVDAGDLTGASTGISKDFGDEPTVEVMNHMGLAVHAAGNHEFDRGLAELRRLRAGGCWMDDCSYRGGTAYPGASFATLSSNVFDAGTAERVFPPWSLAETPNGITVGFVGATVTGAFTEAAEEEIDHDEWWTHLVDSAAAAEAAGADVLVLLRHLGGANTTGDLETCPDSSTFRNPLRNLASTFDVVVDAHTHSAYVCDEADMPLTTQAHQHGTVYTEIQLQVDATTGDVVTRAATNHVVTHDVVPDAGVTAIIDQYEQWWAQLTSSDPDPTEEPTTEPTTEPSPEPTTDPTEEPSPEPTTRPTPKGRKPTTQGTVSVSRVSGADRVATAAELARRFDQADTVLLARADHFADALVAGPLAAQEGAPLLLTHRDGLAAAAVEQLTRLRPERVVLVGGAGALGPEVAAQVAALPWLGADAVERIAGSDRYDTAARIAARIQPDDRREAFLTTGTNYPDALAGAALAAQWQAPVLLTDPAALPAPTEDALAALGLHDLVVLGGDAAVTPDVAAQASEAAGVPARRIAGADRYATAAAVADWFESFSTAMVATGRDFPDALAGVAAAADVDAPVLLVEPDLLPDATAAQVDRVDTTGQDGHVVVIGGAKAVSEDVMLRLVRRS